MKKKHEQSIAGLFEKHFARMAETIGRKPLTSSLDGQDQIYGGDYFVSDTLRFGLVEFKDKETDIKSEGDKPLRLKLCVGLGPWKAEHELAHFISWGRADGSILYIDTNVYANEVCTAEVWPDSSAELPASPSKAGRTAERSFIEGFLSGDFGIEYSRFCDYVEWLESLASKDGHGTGFELIFDDPSQGICGSIAFDSLRDLKTWIDSFPPAQVPPGPPLPGSGMKSNG